MCHQNEEVKKIGFFHFLKEKYAGFVTQGLYHSREARRVTLMVTKVDPGVTSVPHCEGCPESIQPGNLPVLLAVADVSQTALVWGLEEEKERLQDARTPREINGPHKVADVFDTAESRDREDGRTKLLITPVRKVGAQGAVVIVLSSAVNRTRGTVQSMNFY